MYVSHNNFLIFRDDQFTVSKSTCVYAVECRARLLRRFDASSFYIKMRQDPVLRRNKTTDAKHLFSREKKGVLIKPI